MTARSLADLAGRKLRTVSGKAESRAKLIAAVHGAARRTGLGEEDRRAIYADVTGKATLTDMTPAEIGRVLDRLNQGRPAPMAHRAHVAKIRALWWTLYWLGEVDAPGAAALDAFVQRQSGVSALRFLDHRGAPAVIEALKAWAARAGVRWPPVAGKGDAIAERNAVLDAIWLKMLDLRVATRATADGYVAASLAIGADRARWSARELDEAIKLTGKALRRAQVRAAREAAP